ncbi:hypothetical protein JCM11491_003607 [Sporobolomyces phaffii]
MSRSSANRRPSSSSTSARSGSLTTSHEFRPSPLDAVLAEQGLHRYRLEPPSWRAPWESSGGAEFAGGAGEGNASGKAWPVFYPTRDGMDEDQMTESAADTFSAHGHILDNLKAKGMLENLSRIVTAVQQKRETNLPSYGPPTFRLPSRITLTDSKRESWFSDLANPAVPLSKLSRSVPHGYKGEKGLDMLSARKVEIGRAVWFVRAFGGVEIQSLAKSRPVSTAISQYTSEFTSVVCEFVRKQLLGLSLSEPESSAPPPATHSRTRTTSAGLSSSTNSARAQSDFKDPEARTAWKDKFDYTLSLLNSLLSASLLSTPQFIRFLVSIVDPASTTLAQLSVALLLVEEYWDEVLEDEASTARLAKTCLIRLEEVEQASSTGPSALYSTLESTLTSLIQSAFVALPDAFVSLFPLPIFPATTLASSPVPLLPSQISEKLESVLLEAGPNSVTADDVDQDPAVLEMIRADLSDLAHRRLDAVHVSTSATTLDQDQSGSAPSRHPSNDDVESRERAQLDLITRLDNFSFPMSISALHSQIFLSSAAQTPPLSTSTASPNPSPALAASSTTPLLPPRRARSRGRNPILPLEDALPILFTWATTPCRLPGSHRRYTVANLVALELERERQGEEKERGRQGARTRSRVSSSKGPHGVTQAFVAWVDERHGERTEGGGGSGSKPNKQVGNRSDVRGLAEELMRVGAIGYGNYMQKMIARGETEQVSVEGGRESVHLWILQTAAVENVVTKSRQPTRGRDDDVETIQRVQAQLASVQEDLGRIIPGWNGGGRQVEFAAADLDTRSLLAAVSDLYECGERLVVTRDIVSTGLANLVSPSSEAVNMCPETFALLVNIFDQSHDPAGLLQLLVILLRHHPSPTLLVEIVDLVTTRLDLWASLGGLKELAESLASTLETSSGSALRRLLASLRPLANAGYLKGANAERVLKTLPPTVAVVSTVAPPAVASPLVELQTLTVDASPLAVSQLAATLHARYGGTTNESWLGLVIDSSVQILGQLATVDPIVALFKELDERLQGGLEPALIRWMRSKPPQYLVSLLGGPQGSQVVALLSELVVEGVLSLPVLVSDGFFPVWRSILVLVLPDLASHDAQAGSGPLALDPTLSRTLDVLTDALARAVNVPSPGVSTTDHPYPSPLSPAALLTQQRKSVRLGCLFTATSLSTVSSLLALLVLQQEVLTAAGSVDHAQAASSLFLRIVGLQQFQALVVTVPRAVRGGMLESEFIKSLPCFDTFKPKLLAGLLVALKDGGEATPANLVSTEDWDLFLSGLTLWRLAVSKVEVEACLERLDLDSTLSSEDKNDALHTLSNHFLARVCAGQGQTYLGEQVVKCYHGVASDELVSVAFDRLASAITVLAGESESLAAQESAVTAARCTIRLVKTLLQSGVASSRNSSLRQVLQAVKQALGACAESTLTTATDDDATVSLLVNVIDLAIRCTDGPTEKTTADLFAECLSSCATLAVSCAGDGPERSTLATVLLDTCSHLVLALPDLAASPIRLPSIQSLVHSAVVPTTAPGGAPVADPTLPDSTFIRLTRLFGQYAPSARVPNPWELLDHSEPSPATATATAPTSQHLHHPSSSSSTTTSRGAAAAAATTTTSVLVGGFRGAAGTTLTNGGPIDLAAFRAKVVETVPAVTALDALSVTSSSSSSSSSIAASAVTSSTGAMQRGKQTNFDFETPCTGLSVHARDHRRTVSAARTVASKLEQAATSTSTTTTTSSLVATPGTGTGARKRNATGDSLAATAAKTVSSAGGSAATTTSTAPVSGASTTATTTRGTKRKATTTAEVIVIDDEEEDDDAAAAGAGAACAKPAAAKKGRPAGTATRGRKKKV